MANKEVKIGDDWYLGENNDGDLIFYNARKDEIVKAIDVITGAEDKKGNLINNLSSGTFDSQLHSNSIISSSSQETYTIYVDTAAGSDTNDGSSGSPLATVQKAVDLLPDLISHAIIIDIANGIYNEAIEINGKIPVTPGASLTLVGDTSTPSNVRLAGTAGSYALTIKGKSIVTLEGLQVKNTNTSGEGMLVEDFGTQVTQDTCRFEGSTGTGIKVQDWAYFTMATNKCITNSNGEGIILFRAFAYLRSDGDGEINSNSGNGISARMGYIPKIQGIDVAGNGDKGIELMNESIAYGYSIEATSANTNNDIKATDHSKFIGAGSTTGTNILDRTLNPTTFDPTTTPADTSVVVDNR